MCILCIHIQCYYILLSLFSRLWSHYEGRKSSWPTIRGQTGISFTSQPLQLTLLEPDMLAVPDLFPDILHCLRLLDLSPMFEEERDLDFPDVLKRRAKAGEHLCGDVLRSELPADVLVCAEAERGQVEPIGEAVHCFCGDGARAHGLFAVAHAVPR